LRPRGFPTRNYPKGKKSGGPKKNAPKKERILQKKPKKKLEPPKNVLWGKRGFFF